MYQLLLTALVEDSDFKSACSILGGLCGMTPWESANRVLYFQGPPRPVGISNMVSIDRTVRNSGPLWKELHQSLQRQSFVLQARYEVFKHRDMGPSAKPKDLNTVPGLLRWADFPDPAHARPFLAQRKMVELWEQRNLPSVMRDNHYQFKTETVEETYRFFRDEVEFCLTKHYLVRPIGDYTPLETRTQAPVPLESLPSWDNLTPVDQQLRWTLQVKTHVLQDNKPDDIRKAQDQLMAIRAELEGVFDFKPVDRKVYDTRVALQQQGIQALPQKMMLGKA